MFDSRVHLVNVVRFCWDGFWTQVDVACYRSA